MAGRLIPWAAFAALVLLSCYGFYSGRLFHQQVWTPEGMRKLIVFLGLYGVWFLLVTAWRRQLFVPLTCGLVAAYTVASVGFGPVAAALFFAFSCLVLGSAIHRYAGSVEDALLAPLLGLSVYVFVVSLIAHFPVNYPAVYLALLILPLIACRQTTAACFRRCLSLFRPVKIGSGSEHAMVGVGVMILAAHWLTVLKPEVSTDGLAVHLAIPATVANLHYWPFDAGRVIWAVMPMGGDWCYTIAYLTGGEYAARLVNFFLLVAIAGLLLSACRRYLTPVPALLALSLFLGSPLVQLVTGSLFVENVWAALLFGAVIALWRYKENHNRSCLYLGAALAGTAVATKLGALALALPLGVTAAVELYRQRRLRTSGAVIALFLGVAAPPYLTAYLKTGNPVFPFLNSIFHSPYIDSATSFTDVRFQVPLALTTLYDMTFRSSNYLESQNGAFGFHYFLLLPLSLILFRRTWPYVACISLPVSIAFCILILAGQPNLRYVYPALPLFTLAIAAMLRELRENRIALYRAVIAASFVVLFLNLYFLPSAGWHHKGFYLFGAREVEEYLDRSAPSRRLIEYINLKRPDGPVAFFETSQTAGLKTAALTNSWHTDAYLRRLHSAGSPEDYLDLVNELGVGYFVAPTEESGILIRHVPIRTFLARYTVPELQAGDYYVARLREDRPPKEEFKPAPLGIYDDRSELFSYSGQWLRGDFEQSGSGTITYTKTARARLRLNFNGSEVTYSYTKTFNRGMASVTIDGRDRGVIDLYSAQTIWQARTTFRGLAEGSHTIVIEAFPRKNHASSDFFIDVDALEVR